MLKINTIILLLLVSIAIFANENDKKIKKDTTSIILLDENKLDSTRDNLKEDKASLDKNTLNEDSLNKDENNKDELNKEIIVEKDDFKFECKYCKLDNSLAKTFEFGIHMGSPFGIDARFWITDFLGISTMFGVNSDFDPFFNLDFTLSMIKLYSSSTFDMRIDLGVGGMLTTGKDGAGKTTMEGGIFFPIGLSLPFKENPINISLYYAPGVRLSTAGSDYLHRWGVILNYSLGRANRLNENKKCLYNKVKELDKNAYFLKQNDKDLREKTNKILEKDKRLVAKNIIMAKELKRVKTDNRKMKANFKYLTSENIKLETEVNKLKESKGKLNVDIVVIKEEKKQLINDKLSLEKDKENIIKSREKLESEKDILNQKLQDFEKHKEKISNLVDDYNKREDLKFENACKLDNSKVMTFEAGIHAGFLPGADARFWFTDMIGVGTTASIDFPKLDEKLNFLIDFDILFQFSIMSGKNVGLTFDMGLKTSLETDDFSNIGIYLPIGISMPFYKSPIEISAYFAPGVAITTETEFDFKWGVLFNYSFGRAKRIKKYRRCLSDTVENLGLRVEDLKSKNKKLVHGNLWLRHEDEKLKNSNTTLESELKKEKSKIENLKKSLKNIEIKEKELKINMKKLEDEKNNISSENQNLQDFKAKKAAYTEAEHRLKKEKEALEAQLAKEKQINEEVNRQLGRNQETIIKYNEMKCTSTGGTFKNNRCSCSKKMKLNGNICICKGKNQKYSSRANRCVCNSGFTKSKGKCKKCALVNFFGDCVTECFEPEVPWKGKCVCPDSKNFMRDSKEGGCICKPGFNSMGNSCIEGIK